MPLQATTRLTSLAQFRPLLIWIGFALELCCSAQGSREYEIKAVLLFNLTRFVSWPTNAFVSTNSPITIGILGRDPFGRVLDQAVRGEKVGRRNVEVRRVATLAQMRDCQLLFVSASEGARVREILSSLKGLPILTVSDMPGFVKDYGGMTRFYVNEQNKVRLQINLEAARAEGLSISSKLLQVAEVEKASALLPGERWAICRMDR